MLRQYEYELLNYRFFNKPFIWILSVFILSSLCPKSGFSNSVENFNDEPKIVSIGMPKLELDKSSYDFGNIKPNSTNKAVFNLTNIGKEPLIIKEVKKCCGAVIKLEKQQLSPGESGVLTVEYSAGTGIGKLKKTISLVTNELNSTETKLTIKGQMIQTLKWEPKSFEIATFGDEICCPEITIKSLDNTTFCIKSFVSSFQCFSSDIDTNFKATEFVLKPVLFRDKLEKLDSNNGTIKIELEHPDYKTINLNFDIIKSLQAIPAQILVFNAKANESLRNSIKLYDYHNRSEKDLSEQIEFIIAKNGTKVELVKSIMVEKNCKLYLQITPSENKTEKSFSRDQLVIKMKDGRQLTVPIRIFYAF